LKANYKEPEVIYGKTKIKIIITIKSSPASIKTINNLQDGNRRSSLNDVPCLSP